MGIINQSLSWKYSKKTGDVFIVDLISVTDLTSNQMLTHTSKVAGTDYFIDLNKPAGRPNLPYMVELPFRKITAGLMTQEDVRKELEKHPMVKVTAYYEVSGKERDQKITSVSSTIVIVE